MEKITYWEALTTFKSPDEWLDFYYSFLGKFWVQKQFVKYDEKIFTKWVEFDPYSKEYDYNSRFIFNHEIVIDIDCNKDLSRAEFISEQVVKQLNRYNLNYSRWYSGGTGIHIHLFFEELIDYIPYEREIIKREFLKLIDPDRGYVDYSTVYKKRLISLELSKHRKGGIKNLIDYKKGETKNEIPKIILERTKQVIEEENKREYFDEESEKDFSFKDMKCIQLIEQDYYKEVGKDFRRRASFMYGGTLIRKHTRDYIIKKLLHHTNQTRKDIEGIINYLKPERAMTCRGRRKFLIDANLVNLCDSCKLCKNNVTIK